MYDDNGFEQQSVCGMHDTNVLWLKVESRKINLTQTKDIHNFVSLVQKNCSDIIELFKDFGQTFDCNNNQLDMDVVKLIDWKTEVNKLENQFPRRKVFTLSYSRNNTIHH